jgi:hypothetical protein
MALVGTATLGPDVAPRFISSESLASLASAIVQDPGCQARSLAANDDGSTPQITLPFSINFFGVTHNSLFINNNGNVTFNGPQACSGADVTTAIAGSVTLRLTTSFRDDTGSGAGTSIVPTFTGVGDVGGVFVLTGNHFHYNQQTDPKSYPTGSINNSHYFDNVVTLTYNAAPSIVAGQEDARLESK